MLAALGALISVPASAAATGHVSITEAPQSAFAHQRVMFRAVVSPPNDSCLLTIRDSAGVLQKAPRKVAVHGRVSWRINVRAVPGPATVTVACKHGGSASVSLDVRPAKQLPIAIDDKGFTQSPNLGFVSYGIAFRNELTNLDLTNVQLLVNFLDKDNVPVAPSPHPMLTLLPARSTFYYGGRVSLRTVRPVVRIDVRAIAATPAPRIMTTPPLISNQTVICGRVLCGTETPPPLPAIATIVNGVAGQVLLNRSPRMMQSAVMGSVIVDSAGKIVGGGFGVAEALAFGTFESFFVTSSSEILWAGGMRPLVSAVPRYLPRTLVASTLRMVPLNPRAGSPFTVSLEVVDTSISQIVRATGAECLMPGARARAYVSGGRATCTITTPRSARGQTLTGFITGIVGTDRVAKPFTVRLR